MTSALNQRGAYPPATIANFNDKVLGDVERLLACVDLDLNVSVRNLPGSANERGIAPTSNADSLANQRVTSTPSTTSAAAATTATPTTTATASTRGCIADADASHRCHSSSLMRYNQNGHWGKLRQDTHAGCAAKHQQHTRTRVPAWTTCLARTTNTPAFWGR